MRIAIPIAEGKLCPHFGHCQEFALVDVDLDGRKILKNATVQAPPHEPGLLPRWLHEQGANMIIAGGMGARAQQLFASRGIKVIFGASSEEPETIVNDLLHDRLSTGDNICDH